jgi:hypothetical protein
MKCILLLLICFGTFAHAQQITLDTLWLSNTPVALQKAQFGKDSKTMFLNLHSNETTSVDATNEYLKDKNGSLIQLIHDTTRLITFYHINRLIQFDPNRIFTQKGRRINLKLLNRNLPSSAEKVVGAFADSVMKDLKDARIIIAMHNNTDGRPLSVKSFKDRYVNPAMDTDDFILTTEKKIYDQLKKKKINAVLQTQKTSSDDGSLAIYCSKKKIPYINIEAQEGHKFQQVQMLNALTDVIQQYTH